MDKRLWIFGAALLIAVLLWIAVIPRSASSPIEPQGAAAPEPVAAGAAPAAEPSATPDTKEVPAQAEPAPARAAEPAAAQPEPGAKANQAPSPPVVPPARVGPLAKLKQTFESEPRDSAATRVEAKIATVFRQPEVSAGLLRSVLCRQTVCRVTMSWSSERASSYMAVFMHLVLGGDFAHEMATDPVGELDASGHQDVNAYLVRAGPTAATPR